MRQFYQSMLETARQVGLPIIGKWTAARILFIVYAYGGSREEFSLSPKFESDMEYIQKKYGIQGAEIPDTEVAAYIRQLKAEYPTDIAGDENTGEIPDWADKFCKERYGFNLK